ncbi:hypothetical protein B0H14DRAFT_805859 [Mycena olivaceomarginata]|nr:hypothetical protein B0H14DRAFT_805859 [Mycena olivaceomarginata]
MEIGGLDFMIRGPKTCLNAVVFILDRPERKGRTVSHEASQRRQVRLGVSNQNPEEISICPKRTAHSSLSVSPPRHAPLKASLPCRPLPLSPRASVPSKCVPIRAGFHPLVSSVRGRGYGYAVADGIEQRPGKGARPKMGNVLVRDALHCRIWSRTRCGDSGARSGRLGCAPVCECTDCEEEREGPGPQTVLYACGCRRPHLGRTRGRGSNS